MNRRRAVGPQEARTWLFVPGDRPERYEKAQASGADAVIIDLEDAVDDTRKEFARESVRTAAADGFAVALRINAADTEHFEADLDLLRAMHVPKAVVVAKAESAHVLHQVAAATAAPLIALIETACGVAALDEIAGHSAVCRLAFGAVDFSLDIDADADAEVLAPVRMQLVLASRIAGLAAPIDTPSVSLRDEGVIADDARRARAFGFGGKLCIHPAQVALVNEAFQPSPAQIERARALLAAAEGDGAAAFEGAMIDRPVLERARRVLHTARVSA